jgi:hypothetical protein
VEEKLIGKGKVFKGSEFIADVTYDLRIVSRYQTSRTYQGMSQVPAFNEVYLTTTPALQDQFGTERLTLHLSDGRKQDFFVTSGSGACTATGGPHE